VPIAGASVARRLPDPPEHDPLALVRIRPEQLVGGRPAGMLGLGVPLQVPGAEEPAAAAVDRAAPLLPGLARVVEAEQRAWLGLTDLQARHADQHREQALDLAEGPGEGPAERAVRLHFTPLCSNARSREYTASYSRGMTVREMLATLQHLPRDAEVLAFEAGCEEYCEREIDDVEFQGDQGDQVYLHLGARRYEPPRR
jgi:hypothetical protein